MAKENFKVISSAIAGTIAVFINLITSENSYGLGNSLGEKLLILGSYVYDNIPYFIAGFITCFILMRIWQAVAPQSFKSSRTSFFTWFNNLVKEFDD